MERNSKDLIDCEDFREFLRLALEIYHEKSGKVNLAEFSRRAGFSSRSYLSEIISGKKGLSRDSACRIRDSLKLPRKLSQLFELLILKDEPHAAGPKERIDNLDARISVLRQRLREEDQSIVVKNVERVINQPKVLQVYAALGSQESGATLRQIAGRTSLNHNTIRAALKILTCEGVAREHEDRYYAVQEKMDFFELSSSEGLDTLIAQACAEVQRKRRAIINERDNLIFYTTLSIDSKRMGQFKLQLKEAVFEVLDQYQNDDGDKIVQLFFTTYGPTGDLN